MTLNSRYTLCYTDHASLGAQRENLKQNQGILAATKM